MNGTTSIFNTQVEITVKTETLAQVAVMFIVIFLAFFIIKHQMG